MKEAKDFLAKSNSPYSKESISFINHENKKDELKLFWDIRNFYELKGITYMEVPFTALNNMVTSPTHTLVFWKKENGEMEARFKTYQFAQSDNRLNPQIFLESIYDLNGKHVKTNAHQNGKKKKVEIAPDSSPILMEGSCGSYGYLAIIYFCNSPGDFTVTCSATHELYSFTTCSGQDGANSEDSEENGGNGGGGGEGDSPAYDPEPELPNDEIVDVQKLFKCFDNIPNAGATYSVRLLVDIPVNGHPNLPINVATGFSPGHTFLEITKANGTQSVTQTFGFYPKSGPKSVAFASPVPSAIKNDGDKDLGTHEYNASYTLGTISQSDFTILQATIVAETHKPYDLNNYNCAHFATNVINSILEPSQRIEPLRWPAYHPITKQIIYFSNSPSGLYNKFQIMKNNGTWSAYRINLGVNEYAHTSKGECN